MSSRSETKYQIEAGGFFAIQQLQHTGTSAMPRPHSHAFYELYYLFQGERVYFIDGKVITVKKGEMVIVAPGDLHSTTSSQVAEFERVLVHFSPEFLSGGSAGLFSLPPLQESALLPIPLKEQPAVEQLLLQMLGECREPQPLQELYIRHLLGELLVRLHRASLTASEPAGSPHPMHHKVSEITAYIRQHYSEDLRLEEMSRLFFISPAYLSRIFLKLTGFHFSEYIRVVRVREAQNLLRSTSERVQTIAERVGFEHISHFNKTFRSVAGCSPLQYRNQSKG